MRTLVCGSGGFIGGHLVKRLMDDGHDVRAVDIKPFDDLAGDGGEGWWQFHEDAENHEQIDLSDPDACHWACADMDRVFNLAADMGGIGFIETHKAACMLSVLVSTNMLLGARDAGVQRFLYTSSACVYPDYRQDDPDVVALDEAMAYPAMPEDGYGWEKLFSERMARHFREDYGLETRIARLHNVYGPMGSWTGGREKSPSALCRKVAEAVVSGDHRITIWGDGASARSYCFVADAVEGLVRIMECDYPEPLNLGSSELVTINELVTIVEDVAGVQLQRRYDLAAPQGVRGRNSDNTLIRATLDWEPSTSLRDGIAELYPWIESMVRQEAAK